MYKKQGLELGCNNLIQSIKFILNININFLDQFIYNKCNKIRRINKMYGLSHWISMSHR
jgi:hypothetical protein